MSDQREDLVGHRFDSVDFEQVLDELRGPGTVEDEYWERIWALQRRVGRGTFDRCVGLLNGPDGLDRRIGADVLSQLGYRDDKPWADESIPHLLSRLEDSRTKMHSGIAGLPPWLRRQRRPSSNGPVASPRTLRPPGRRRS
ncbi:hypothetical protein [Candidatus Amarobacter glycogenicus]|uniref:hypothetical protein n=1 Tax=Candidatus Amarobacter glycogenicus TaxID=3140699 RepID=UPI002A10975A|nr:hypothetical protein [Dehalococcoidia bacterium]